MNAAFVKDLLRQQRTFIQEEAERNEYQFDFLCFFAVSSNRTGNRIRFVNVATNKVTDVSQPNAKVPSKLLKQKITNPAINTSEV